MSLSATRYKRIMAAAAAFYQGQLASHAPARDYLLGERGLSERTVRRYGLGYAPPGLADLRNALRVEIEDLVEAGLAKKRPNDGRVVPVLRERVVFPIRATPREVVAFGGRVLPDAPAGAPKYLNSPNGEHFAKRDWLYGLDALVGHPRPREISVVEGYLDVIALGQAGAGTVPLAGLGTALTAQQALKIAHMICEPDRPVILLYDGDAAGRKAMVQAARVLLEAGVHDTQLRMAALPSGEDPDTWVRGRSVVQARKWLDSRPVLAAWLEEQIGQLPQVRSVEGRVRYGERVGKWLSHLQRPQDRHRLIHRLAQYLAVDPERLRQWYRQAPQVSPRAGPHP